MVRLAVIGCGTLGIKIAGAWPCLRWNFITHVSFYVLTFARTLVRRARSRRSRGEGSRQRQRRAEQVSRVYECNLSFAA